MSLLSFRTPDGRGEPVRRALRSVPLLVTLRLLRENFWFLPLLMVLGALGLAALALWTDGWLDRKSFDTPALAWIELGGHEGARSLLAALAGAIVTVAGVVFSVTIAVLTLTTSQFGPRLLRQFLRDRGIQAVLGTFLGTFVYTLVVSLALGNEGSLPRVSVLTAAALTLTSVGVFVYFVHHVATHIQADHVVAAAAGELERVIQGVYGEAKQPQREERSKEVRSPRAGYVTGVDLQGLLDLAVRHDVVLDVVRPPGAFVRRGDPLLSVEDGDALPCALLDDLEGCFYLGISRTSEQDVESAIEQLVEVGVRALSPALNDHFTAVRCLDRLSSALCTMAALEPPQRVLVDDEDRPRVRIRWFELPQAIRRALGPLNEAGADHALVQEALAGAITRLARATSRPDALKALAAELETLQQASARLPESARGPLTDPLRRAATAISQARSGAPR